MTNIPAEAIHAAASALRRVAGTEDSIESQAEAILRAALPHLDGYAAGQEAMRAAAIEAVEAKALALGRQECCGCGIGSPPECCADPLYMLSSNEATSEILALPIAPPPSPWRPIETAPKTSHAILVWCPERQNIFAVTWAADGGRSGWRIFGGEPLYQDPTHWMPLPAPPVEGGRHD